MTRFDDGQDDEPFRLGRGRVDRSSEKALRVMLEPSSLLGAKAVWVPRSVLHADSEVFDDEAHREGDLVVLRWFARKQGWEVE